MKVSMIITTHNRAPLLEWSLQCLRALTIPDEILIVDDGGDDYTDVVVDQFPDLPIRYIYNHNPGETHCCLARNIALRAAQYDEIVVSEPEIVFLTDVIDQLAAARTQHPEVVLREDLGYWVTAYRRQWLLDIGGWDEALPGAHTWDDQDLYERLDRCGHPLLSVPEVKVAHQWHERRDDPAATVANELYVRAKKFPRDLIANREAPWGITKTT